MKKELPIANDFFLLEKYPGKGGWTYAQIPNVPEEKKRAFGMVRVKGSIDGFEFKQFNLMPMRNKNLFLPIKAEIRKAIKKKDGDKVHIILYLDDTALEIPKEFEECLSDEPKAYKFFQQLTDSEKNFYIKWIYSAKRSETKIERMVNAIDRLSKHYKFYTKNESD